MLVVTTIVERCLNDSPFVWAEIDRVVINFDVDFADEVDSPGMKAQSYVHPLLKEGQGPYDACIDNTGFGNLANGQWTVSGSDEGTRYRVRVTTSLEDPPYSF